MSLVVEAQGLTVRSRGRMLLDGVDLRLEAGQIMTLVGPNGSGKSTLLKALIGLRRPGGGRVHRRPGLRIGYVPQHFQVDRNLPLTVTRFLSLGVDSAGVAAVAREVEVTRLLERPMQVLSGGELRRVLLARALLRSPDLLALDEPAAGLDLHGQGEIYRLIEQARRERGCAVVQISHDLHLVMEASDQVLCLTDGRVCCDGTPQSVQGQEGYQALLGAELAPGEALYRHRHDHQEQPRHG